MPSYKDRNGVIWNIVNAPGGQSFGTPDPFSQIKYDPEPADVGPANAEGAVASLIEAYAAGHKADVVLEVKATPDGAGIIVLLVLLLLASE